MKLRSHPCPFNDIIGEAKKRCPRNKLGVLQTVVIAGLYSEKEKFECQGKREYTHKYACLCSRKTKEILNVRLESDLSCGGC
jgi:hypothetical protein